jgi:hypothetical protein
MATVGKPNPGDVEKTEAEATPEAAPVAEKKSTKTPLAEGEISPVDFAKVLSEQYGEEVRPQIVYGYLKNMKGFKEHTVDRGEGVKPQIVIKKDEALAFLAAKREEQKAKAEAKKAAAEAAKAEAPASA